MKPYFRRRLIAGWHNHIKLCEKKYKSYKKYFIVYMRKGVAPDSSRRMMDSLLLYRLRISEILSAHVTVIRRTINIKWFVHLLYERDISDCVSHLQKANDFGCLKMHRCAWFVRFFRLFYDRRICICQAMQSVIRVGSFVPLQRIP